MVNHIAVILDGNRRYAKKHNLSLYKGHEKGAENVEKLMDWARELGVKELTLYSFSMQNFNRTKSEFNYLMSLFEIFFKKALARLRKTHENVRFNFIGRLVKFPSKIQKLANDLMIKTKKNKELVVNFAFGYGGREEIIDAVKRIVKKKLDVSEKSISDNLYLKSEPEIIIRPGGEKRTSNFLIWQSTYSEWFFINKFWPEFTKNDLKRIICEYGKRERRYGV